MVTPAVQLYINKVNVLVNLDGCKECPGRQATWAKLEERFWVFPVGRVEWAGDAGLTSHDWNWPFYPSTVSCK